MNASIAQDVVFAATMCAEHSAESCEHNYEEMPRRSPGVEQAIGRGGTTETHKLAGHRWPPCDEVDQVNRFGSAMQVFLPSLAIFRRGTVRHVASRRPRTISCFSSFALLVLLGFWIAGCGGTTAVAAVNASRYLSSADDVVSDTLQPVSTLQLVSTTGGTALFTMDDNVTAALNDNGISIVFEQRRASELVFIESVSRLNANFSVTVYRLLHDSFYTFRAYTLRSSGEERTVACAPVVVVTGRPGNPGQTPAPVINSTTGTLWMLRLRQLSRQHRITNTALQVAPFHCCSRARLIQVSSFP